MAAAAATHARLLSSNMVHVRLNEREINPNPHINFITALPMPDAADQEEARQLLRALAAQVRPVMKAHGFVVNSFEEYEFNKVFAGRNWNAGEVVELVLREASGAFSSISWLMSTLCHELAHITHQNHGPAFQALWAKLRAEVRELQSKGYYGDGYWSSGKRLADSARVGGESLGAGDLPEYMCGGAQARKRPTSLRRRRTAGPSQTGAQTAKRRKAGSRVTAKGTFRGSGRAVNEDASDEEQKKSGAGFRKKAGSKRAREERALAAERRLKALQGAAGPSTESREDEIDEDEEDSDVEIVEETDQERRRTMLDATAQNDMDNLKSSQTDFSSDFIFPRISSTTDEEPPCDVQILSRPSATATSAVEESSSRKGKQRVSSEVIDLTEETPNGKTAPRKKAKRDVPYGNLIEDEMKQRKLESLGLTGTGQRLGGNRKAPPEPQNAKSNGPASRAARSSGQLTDSDQRHNKDKCEWNCLVCTLSNAPEHLACAACTTPRGESTWARQPT